jgi:uroporphyrinogen-III synthase
MSSNASPLTLIVTRPRAQAAAWVQRLQALEVPAVSLPLIDIAPVANAGPLKTAWRALPTCDLVMFVSANAVDHFFAAQPEQTPWPVALGTAVTGPGSLQSLLSRGVDARRIVCPQASSARVPQSQFDSEHLWNLLAQRPEGWQGKRVLIVRGSEDEQRSEGGAGRPWLGEQLRNTGAQVEYVAAYQRVLPVWTPEEAQLFAQIPQTPGRYVWLFSSSLALRHLSQLLRTISAKSWAIATHPRIAAAADRVGFTSVAQSLPVVEDIARAFRQFS